MLFEFEGAGNSDNGSSKDLLIREAEEAFELSDRVGCVDAISRLYDMLDETMVSPRRGRPKPSQRRTRS